VRMSKRGVEVEWEGEGGRGRAKGKWKEEEGEQKKFFAAFYEEEEICRVERRGERGYWGGGVGTRCVQNQMRRTK
jgi:hypothetical protein